MHDTATRRGREATFKVRAEPSPWKWGRTRTVGVAPGRGIAVHDGAVRPTSAHALKGKTSLKEAHSRSPDLPDQETRERKLSNRKLMSTHVTVKHGRLSPIRVPVCALILGPNQATSVPIRLSIIFEGEKNTDLPSQRSEQYALYICQWSMIIASSESRGLLLACHVSNTLIRAYVHRSLSPRTDAHHVPGIQSTSFHTSFTHSTDDPVAQYIATRTNYPVISTLPLKGL